jgi:CheY-like chemotaxis protein
MTMATILLVEDSPDLGFYEARLLEGRGHRVVRCNGAPSPLAACPMLKRGSCPLPDSADVILFSSPMFGPIRHRTYRGAHLLSAYRNHPTYGRKPMLVVSAGAPLTIEGQGPYEVIEKFSPPHMILEAVDRLVEMSNART